MILFFFYFILMVKAPPTLNGTRLLTLLPNKLNKISWRNCGLSKNKFNLLTKSYQHSSYIVCVSFKSSKCLVNYISCWATPRKIPKFHLISWCRNFVEKHSFCIVLGDLPEAIQKLCLSTKFPHHESRCN